MKKCMSLLLSGVMLVCLCGCNDAPATSEGGGSTTTTTTATTKTTAITTIIPITNKTDGTTMTDDEAVTLCADKINMVYTLRYWYRASNPAGSDTIPLGATATNLAGENSTITAIYYPFAESFNGAVINTASQLKEIISSVYTDDIAHKFFYTSVGIVEYNGVLYRNGADATLLLIWDESSIRITKKSANALTFLIDAWDKTTSYEYTLVFEKDNWKFDKYLLAY